jgi:hypothetical protein
VSSVEVDGSGREPIEADLILGHRWWAAAEIAASRDTFVPRRLGELLPPLPDAPAVVGV